MRGFVLGLVVASGMSLVLGGQAFAAPILFDNPSFETPQSPLIQTGAGPFGTIPNWAFQSDSGVAGQNTRDVATYPLSNGALPGGEGNIVAFINLSVAGQVNQAFNNVPAGYQTSTAYTVTVALGNPSRTNVGEGYRDPGYYRLQFLAQSGTVLATSPNIYADAVLPAGAAPGSIAGGILDGQLKDFSFTFTTPATAGTTASQRDVNGNVIPDFLVPVADYNAIRLQIQTVSTANDQQSSFDNVRLDATSVPEPTALAVVAAGGLVLTRRRRSV